jgi:uncharacterized membrane protein YccC
MRYSIEIKKFLYSQYFFGGLRTAIGISLPAILAVLFLHNEQLGFTLASGAIGASVVDLPGPLKYKTNEMLACTAIGFLSALATGIATANPFTLWLTVVPLTFVLSMIVVYGNKWLQISFATLFMMVITVDEHFTLVEALSNAGCIFLGGLWYTGWSTLVSRWQWQRIERQAISECIFATSDYLRARADFYDMEIDLADSYRHLVARQIAAVDRQEAARDIVLRNLPQFRRGELDTRRTGLFNLFIHTVDLHDTIVAAHTDYAHLRDTVGSSDLMLFCRDAIHKLARELDSIGLAVLEDIPSRARLSVKAELRALEYEIELMRKHDAPDHEPAVYATVVATYRRVWSASRLIEKMHRNTHPEQIEPATEVRVDQALNRFLSGRSFSAGLIFSNLSMSSPSFRHALRVTLAVALGLWVGKFLPLTNSYWIVMTTIIILKPGFSLTRQRNTQRLIGTFIGCLAAIVLVLLVKTPDVLLAVMFACMVMSYSLLLFNYTASVVFTSSWVLILLHMLAPGGIRIIGERALDTFVGSSIAIAASYLFPYWEYRVMGRMVKAMIASTRQYLDAACALGTSGASAPASAAAPAAAPGATALALKEAELERDYRYRLSRKNVHIAFANLGNAFQRMMMEPRAQQRYVPELNELLVQSHALASQITAAAPLFAALVTPAHAQLLEPLQQALNVVRDNLSQAESADATPAEAVTLAPASAPAASAEMSSAAQGAERTVPAPAGDAGAPHASEAASLLGTALKLVPAPRPVPAAEALGRTRELNRSLDAMVVSAEGQYGAPAEVVQELKLLVHQCKQMISASWLIRNDACLIQASLR